MKIIRILFYIAAAATVMVAIFAMWTGRSYMDIHTITKGQIEHRFQTLPFEDFFNKSYYNYLRATQRGYFNGVALLTDGRLMLNELDDRVFIQERTDDILWLDNYLNEREIPFLYVRVPSKIQDNSVIPRPFSDNSIIEDGDYVLNYLKDRGVDTLDLREIMDRTGVDYYSAYYRGDHHWTAETALWALGEISKFVNSEYGFNVDTMVWDPQQYQHIIFERGFLGEEAETINATHLSEDITALVPMFDTGIMVTDIREIDSPQTVSAGSFVDVFIPKLHDENNTRLLYGELNAVHRYFNRYENFEAGNQKNVLLIADSMGIPLSAYMSTAFGTVDNLMLFYGANHRIWPAIERNNYDLVIYVLSDVIVAFEDTHTYEADRLFLGRPPGYSS